MLPLRQHAPPAHRLLLREETVERGAVHANGQRPSHQRLGVQGRVQVVQTGQMPQFVLHHRQQVHPAVRRAARQRLTGLSQGPALDPIIS